MANWKELFEAGLLDVCGPKTNTLSELAEAISIKLKRNVSADSLFAAHKRHRTALKLKPSLMDYTANKPDKKSKKSRVKPEDIKFQFSREKRKVVRSSKRFIITSATNNCHVDEAVWASIQHYSRKNNAEIIVIPVRYKNPTSLGETKTLDEDAWWDNKVVPHVTDNLVKLHEHLWLMAHVRVQATAVNPLQGLEALSKGASAVFGHAQLAMKMVATPQQRLPKVMYTTGSVTIANYSDTRAGVKGEFHHGFGAVVVELDGPRFHIRAVNADKSGGFYDLDWYYAPDGARKNKEGTLALVTGDEHVMFNDSQCRAATYENKDSIVNVLKPKQLVRHDVIDSYSISHWNRKDPVVQFSKHQLGHNQLLVEMEQCAKFIEHTTPKGVKNVVVSSNHHDHILRWMKEVNGPKDEPWNARTWLALWTALIDTIEFEERGVVHADPFALWMSQRLKVPTEFIGPDSPYQIADVAVGMHGHHGTNGSRGTLNQFSKIGVKTIIGHSHTPGIKHGCVQVGTSSTLRMDYTKGPSSWAHAHCVIYPNGKRQLIFVVRGRWRG